MSLVSRAAASWRPMGVSMIPGVTEQMRAPIWPKAYGFPADQPVHAAFRPRVGHAGILDLGPDRVPERLEKVGGQRVVEHGVGREVVRPQGEQRGDRREADHRGPRLRQGTTRVDEQRGADEIDCHDPPPVRHGRRDAGGVGDGAQRAELRGPGDQAGDAGGILDVEDEGLDLGPRLRRRQAVRLGRE